jgi:hypothetical protein
MAQFDFTTADGPIVGTKSFPNTRADINSALLALVSNSSGDAEPTGTQANQFWYETDTNTLKIRNEANDGWINVLTLDESMTASASELNLLDDLTRGSILYGDASGETARLAKGAANTVLTSDGTDISWADAGGGSTELITSVTASDDATISFTQFDSTKYDYYKFVFVNMVPVTNDESLKLRTSTNGGSSYDATQNDYLYITTRIRAIQTGYDASLSSGVAGTQSFPLDTAGTDNTASVGGTSGTVQIFSPSTLSYTHIMVEAISSRSNSTPNMSNTSGYRASAADVDAVQFFFSSGNITSGTIYMYGLKSA